MSVCAGGGDTGESRVGVGGRGSLHIFYSHGKLEKGKDHMHLVHLSSPPLVTTSVAIAAVAYLSLYYYYYFIFF